MELELITLWREIYLIKTSFALCLCLSVSSGSLERSYILKIELLCSKRDSFSGLRTSCCDRYSHFNSLSFLVSLYNLGRKNVLLIPLLPGMMINKPGLMACIKNRQIPKTTSPARPSAVLFLSVEGKIILTKLFWFIKNHIVLLLV